MLSCKGGYGAVAISLDNCSKNIMELSFERLVSGRAAWKIVGNLVLRLLNTRVSSEKKQIKKLILKSPFESIRSLRSHSNKKNDLADRNTLL